MIEPENLIRIGRLLGAPGVAPVHRDVAIVVQGDRIVAIEQAAQTERSRELIALPALVNAHDHGYGLVPMAFGACDDALEPWITGLGGRPATDPYLEAAVAFARMALSGIAATVHCHNSLKAARLLEEAEAVARAAADVGIRVAFSCPILDRNPWVYGGIEAIRPLFDEQGWQRVSSLVPQFEPAARQLERVEEIARRHESHGFTVQYGPIGPQWCRDETLEAIAEASARSGRRVHMHLLETRRQREWTDGQYGEGIVRHLDRLGLLSPRLTVAHGVWLDEEESALLAERGVTVAVNSSSNLRLRSGLAPVASFVERGLGFALGLDGMALDDDQDALRELRLAWLLHAGTDLEPRVSKARLLEAATRRGAYAFDGTHGAGVLEPGARADVLCLDYARMSRDIIADAVDELDVLMARMSARQVVSLHVGGRAVVAEGRLQTVDLPALERELDAQARAGSGALAESAAARALLRETVRRYYREGRHRPSAETRDPAMAASPARAPASGPGAERRQLTVMFCDMVGSTELSTRLDPEDLRDVMGLYQEACGEVVARFGGHVALVMGDGVLAYFGYPQAYEDNAERAVRAGLGIIERLPELNATLDLPDYEMKVRIGIATGLVVVGDTAGEGPTERAAVVGETPNIAARLQAAAEPNTVVVGHATRQLLGELFELRDLGLRALKGVAAPQHLWRVVRESVTESRFAAARGDRIELVDRTTELARLLAGWQRVKDGAGRAVALVGEAGIGKSHLALAFLERLAADPHTRLHCQCSPYHSNSALYPIVHQLERACGFERGDAPDIKRAKLAKWLTGHAAARDSLVPGFAKLLGLPDDPEAGSPGTYAVEPEEGVPAALARLAVSLTERQPLVVLFEDIQWIDPTSLELVGELARRASGLRILLVVTYRPEYVPRWAGRVELDQVVLGHVAQVHSEQIIERSAGGRELPGAVVAEIVAKTGGIPLFVAELTRAVLESGQIDGQTAGAVTVPATLQDALMARLDHLGEAKEIAQTAAILGRTFSRRLLAAIVPHPTEALDAALALLMRTELVQRSDPASDDGFEFRHALIRDVAYQSMLLRRRRALHQRTATILESDFPEIVESEPEIVAHHFTEAGLHARAVTYWQRAGRRAMARFATQEAATLFAKALNMPEAQARDYQKMLLQADLGAADMVQKGFDYATAAEALLRAYQSTPGGDDPLRLGRSLKALVWFHCRQMQLDRARDVARRLLHLAERLQDPGLSTAAHQSAGITALLSGELVQARNHFERGIEHYNPADHERLAEDYGLDLGVNCMSLGAIALWLLGQPDRAAQQVEDSLAAIRGRTHVFTVSVTQSWAARIFAMLGDDAATRYWAEVTIAYATEHDVPMSHAEGLLMGGWVAARQGSAEGLEAMERGLALKRDSGSRMLLPYFLGRLAEANAALGRHDAALAAVAEGLDLARDTGELWWEAELHRLRGDILLQSGDTGGEPESGLDRALETARRAGALSLELRAAMSLCRLHHAGDRAAEARATLATIYGRFRDKFATADLVAARRLLRP